MIVRENTSIKTDQYKRNLIHSFTLQLELKLVLIFDIVDSLPDQEDVHNRQAIDT